MPVVEITKAFARLSVIDSRRWISFLLDILPKLSNLNLASLTSVEQRMLQMFYITVWGKAAESWDNEEVLSNLQTLTNSPTLIGELISLRQYQYERIDFIDNTTSDQSQNIVVAPDSPSSHFKV